MINNEAKTNHHLFNFNNLNTMGEPAFQFAMPPALVEVTHYATGSANDSPLGWRKHMLSV